MQLDLRLPIGMMFTIFGVILVGYGLASDDAIYARSLGVNVNLWWGLVLLAFGSVMLAFALRAERRRRTGADGPPAGSPPVTPPPAAPQR
jgi:membrane protein implicated in regulation of membrane protease activity